MKCIKDLFQLDKNKNKWICQVKNGSDKICGAELANSGNTSGRTLHVEAKHKDIQLAKVEKPKASQETSKSSSFSMSSSESTIREALGLYPADSARSKKLNQAVLRFIIHCYQPFSIVEDPIFIAMLKAFDPRHNQRGRKFLSKEDLFAELEMTTKAVKNVLLHVGFVAYTSDCWSANSNAYMSLTCHFIDNAFVHQHCLLGFFYKRFYFVFFLNVLNFFFNIQGLAHAPESHTGEYLGKNIDAIINEKWDLRKKVIK